MKLLLENWRKFKLPLIFENSKLPVWLSKIAPIEINALSFFIFVFARGKLDARVKRHETIHYKQQVEMLFVFQWILMLFWTDFKFKGASPRFDWRPHLFSRGASSFS